MILRITIQKEQGNWIIDAYVKHCIASFTQASQCIFPGPMANTRCDKKKIHKRKYLQ